MSVRTDNSLNPQGWRPESVFVSEAAAPPLHAPVLVLNASYEPINVCAARRAIVLVLKGVARTEEENGNYMHAARLALRVPSVIRLLEYRRIPHQTRALSRKNILLREPRSFNLHTSRHIMRLMGRSDDKWRKYLFY